MKRSKAIQSGFTIGFSAAIAVASIGCSAKINGIGTGGDPIQDQPKDSTHVNYIQCSDAKKEALIDVTNSDLEGQKLNNTSVYVRDITQAGSAYSQTVTDEPTMAVWKTMEDPTIRQFELGAKSGLDITVSTRDFKTGTAVFLSGSDSAELMNCTLSAGSRPARPPVPQAPAPEPTPAPSASPSPAPAAPLYVDCKGQAYEVYLDFTGVDPASWRNVGDARMGSRSVKDANASFTFYPSSMTSSYQMGGTNYASMNDTDAAGNQFNLNLTGSGQNSMSASVEAVSASGRETTDSLSCQYLQTDIYAGKYGW